MKNVRFETCALLVRAYTSAMTNTDTTPTATTRAFGTIVLTLTDGVYSWRSLDGKRRSRYFGTEAEALRYCPA